MSSPLPDGPLAPSRARLFGVYVGVVTDVQDPDNQGRVKVRLPWLDPDDTESAAWARLVTMMAGDQRGTWFIPEVGDEVLLAFVAGDPRWPVVTGALWNGKDAPPESMNANNDLRSITSRAGHKLTFDDTSGAGKVVVETASGHVLMLDEAGGGKVILEHMNGAKLEIDASGKVTITALAMLKVEAASVQVDAAMSTFSGVVKCDALITNMVQSAMYTPGAGNVW